MDYLQLCLIAILISLVNSVNIAVIKSSDTYFGKQIEDTKPCAFVKFPCNIESATTSTLSSIASSYTHVFLDGVFASANINLPNTKIWVIDPTSALASDTSMTITFSEPDVGFLAGILVGLVSYTKSVAVVSDKYSLRSKRYSNGFKQGVLYSWY